jgi:hypothetical protein
MPSLSPAMASLALSMIYSKTERDCTVGSFQGRPGIAQQAIDDALNRKLTVDAFIIATDGGAAGAPTYARTLERYRTATGVAAKLVLIAMAAGHCNMADSDDPLQLSIAGFDASVPEVVAEFLRA